jgi:hypothetical protein
MRGWKELRHAHPAAPDIAMQSALFEHWSRENLTALQTHGTSRGAGLAGGGAALDVAPHRGPAQTGLELLRDLQSLWLMANASTAYAAAVLQGARAGADRNLEHDLSRIARRNARQCAWLLARIRQAAPQALTVPTP